MVVAVVVVAVVLAVVVAVVVAVAPVKAQLHLIKHDAKMPCKCVELQLHAFSTTPLDLTNQSASCPGRYIPDEKARPYTFYWKLARPTAIWISGVESCSPLGNRTKIPQLSSP